MDTILGYPSPADVQRERRKQRGRLELGLIVGGSLGIAAITLLRMSDRHKEANALTFVGVLAGGLIATLRVLEQYPEV